MLPSATATTAPLRYSRHRSNQKRWLQELGELLAFPTISAQPRHRPDIEAAARWLREHLTNLGLTHAQILPGPGGGYPSVYADWLFAPGQPTMLLYGHYDVQPVDPLKAWRTPPFHATRVGAHLYARGASDDKGQLFIHLKAIESYLATIGSLPVNVKIWLEGEEESQSSHLAAFLERESEKIRADVVLVSDTAMLRVGQPTIVYGLRGSLVFELEVKGLRRDVHAGTYGGAVLNPLQALCEIIAGLHDEQGRVTIPGFYDHVLPVTESERRDLRYGAPSDAELLADLAVPAGWGEEGYTLFERTTIRPALTVNGIGGGYTGPGSKAVIPARAIARLSMRLVPAQDPQEIAHLLRRHIMAIKQVAIDIRLKITGGSPPVLISRRHPVFAATARAVYRTWGVPPIFLRSGGTITFVSLLQRRLHVPVILLGFGLPGDNIHGANERISLPNFFRGIETIIQLLEEFRR